MTVVYSNKRILLYLFICLLCHVGIMYSVGSVIYAIYSLEDFNGAIPFNFKEWIHFEKCCSYTKSSMVNTLTLVISYPLSGMVFGFLIPGRIWDFSISTTFLHLALSCLVMLDFPTNWSWWICLGVGCLLMTGIGEGVSALRRCRDQNRLVVPEKAESDEPVNYLQR